MLNATSAEPADDNAVLVISWYVSDGHQGEFVESLEDLFEYLRGVRGFVEGAILRGVNQTRFVTYATMQSPQDRQQVLEDAEVSKLLWAARRIAADDLHSYEILHSFGARGSFAGPDKNSIPGSNRVLS